MSLVIRLKGYALKRLPFQLKGKEPNQTYSSNKKPGTLIVSRVCVTGEKRIQKDQTEKLISQGDGQDNGKGLYMSKYTEKRQPVQRFLI